MDGLSVSTVTDLLTRGTSVFAIAFAINHFLKERSAALRHAIWLLALPAALAAPSLSLLIPRLSFKVLPIRRLTSPDSAAIGVHPTGDPFPAILIGLYLAGLGVVLALMVLGRIYVKRIIKNASPLRREDATDILRMILERLRIRSGVGLLSSNRVAAPKAAGIFKPVIILPEAAESWPRRVLESVLWHELAHVKRKDLLSRAVGQLSCGLNWFNPLAWLAFRRMLAAQESSCDDCAARNGIPASEYAANLLLVAGGDASFGHAMAGMARFKGLAKRLMSILRSGRDTRPLSPGSLAAVLFFASLLLLPVATLDFVARERPGSKVEPVSMDDGCVQTDEAERTDLDEPGTRQSSRKGIERDRLKIIERTEDAIYFTYTIDR